MSAARQRKRGDSQREEYDRQREHQERQRLMEEAFNHKGELDRGWMREILDTEDLEEHLQPFTIKKIQAMLNKEWVLSNLTDAEAHDRIWWLETMRLKIYGEHPPEESSIQGPLRAFLFDDETEGLWALTSAERNAIDQIIKTVQNRTTRGRGGFERKQMNTNIARTESEKAGSGEKQGRLRGLF